MDNGSLNLFSGPMEFEAFVNKWNGVNGFFFDNDALQSALDRPWIWNGIAQEVADKNGIPLQDLPGVPTFDASSAAIEGPVDLANPAADWSVAETGSVLGEDIQQASDSTAEALMRSSQETSGSAAEAGLQSADVVTDASGVGEVVRTPATFDVEAITRSYAGEFDTGANSVAEAAAEAANSYAGDLGAPIGVPGDIETDSATAALNGVDGLTANEIASVTEQVTSQAGMANFGSLADVVDRFSSAEMLAQEIVNPVAQNIEAARVDWINAFGETEVFDQYAEFVTQLARNADGVASDPAVASYYAEQANLVLARVSDVTGIDMNPITMGYIQDFARNSDQYMQTGFQDFTAFVVESQPASFNAAMDPYSLMEQYSVLNDTFGSWISSAVSKSSETISFLSGKLTDALSFASNSFDSISSSAISNPVLWGTVAGLAMVGSYIMTKTGSEPSAFSFKTSALANFWDGLSDRVKGAMSSNAATKDFAKVADKASQDIKENPALDPNIYMVFDKEANDGAGCFKQVDARSFQEFRMNNREAPCIESRVKEVSGMPVNVCTFHDDKSLASESFIVVHNEEELLAVTEALYASGVSQNVSVVDTQEWQDRLDAFRARNGLDPVHSRTAPESAVNDGEEYEVNSYGRGVA